MTWAKWADMDLKDGVSMEQTRVMVQGDIFIAGGQNRMEQRTLGTSHSQCETGWSAQHHRKSQRPQTQV